MKVLLLLAGRSRRFWPLSEKALFPICGKTLLEHVVDRLRLGGCLDIILVGGAHNLEGAKKIFPDFPAIEQKDLDLGMRGAVLCALPHIKNEPVMVVGTNDVIEPAGYQAVVKAAKGCDGAILGQKVDHYFPGGYLGVEGKKITSIIEKPGEGKEPSDLVNIVAHVHNDPKALQKALEHVGARPDAADSSVGARDDGYEQALAMLFREKEYHVAPYEGLWQAVKYPWHFLNLLPIFLKEITKPRIHPSVKIHPTAVIEGNVIIEEGSRVFAHASVVGPCYIGKNVTIANNTLVRSASIGDHSVVGFGSEVKVSIFDNYVWTHMTYVGDSVIGRNVSFGAGCATGNLRLDEEEVESVVQGERISTKLVKCGAIIGNDARLGIHVGINPGIKIGSGSFISSGTLLSEDIPERSFVMMKDGILSVRPNRTSAPFPEGREVFRKGIRDGMRK